jgi:hypothetical protein
MVQFPSWHAASPPQGTTLSPAATRLPPLSHDPSRHALCLRVHRWGVYRACASARSHKKIYSYFLHHCVRNTHLWRSHFRRMRTYRFDGDIGHIIIDVSLVCRRVATRRRSCRPQRVDFWQNSSTRGRNALASTASPNNPITTLLVRRHLLRNGQHPQWANRRGGGLCSPTREVIIIIIIIYFITYLYFMLTSYPPPSLLLLTSTTGRLMIALRARRRFWSRGWRVEVEVEAEEGAEDVGVGQNNYEEPSLVSLFDLLERRKTFCPHWDYLQIAAWQRHRHYPLLPHKIFCNLCRSERIFRNNRTRQSAWTNELVLPQI